MKFYLSVCLVSMIDRFVAVAVIFYAVQVMQHGVNYICVGTADVRFFHWNKRLEVIVGRSLSHQILIVGSFYRANAYLISWTKLEGTRPVSFASLVPFKKPSKFKLEITFIISFFCIMLLFAITIRFYFNFRRIHLIFYQNLIETFIGLGYDFVRNLYFSIITYAA